MSTKKQAQKQTISTQMLKSTTYLWLQLRWEDFTHIFCTYDSFWTTEFLSWSFEVFAPLHLKASSAVGQLALPTEPRPIGNYREDRRQHLVAAS